MPDRTLALAAAGPLGDGVNAALQLARHLRMNLTAERMDVRRREAEISNKGWEVGQAVPVLLADACLYDPGEALRQARDLRNHDVEAVLKGFNFALKPLYVVHSLTRVLFLCSVQPMTKRGCKAQVKHSAKLYVPLSFFRPEYPPSPVRAPSPQGCAA